MQPKPLTYEAAWRLYRKYDRGKASRAELYRAVEALKRHAKTEVTARYLLASIHDDGTCPYYDRRAALHHFAICVKQRLPGAALRLARMHGDWSDRRPNHARSLHWLLEGHRLGHVDCRFRAGLAIGAGRGTEADAATGRMFIKKATSFPDALAVDSLLDLLQGAGWRQAELIVQLRSALEQGSSEAALILGVLAYFGVIEGGLKAAVALFRKSAIKDNAGAMWNLHVCHADDGGGRKDAAKARYWRKRSEECRVALADREGRFVGIRQRGTSKINQLPMIGKLVLSSFPDASSLIDPGTVLAAQVRWKRRAGMEGW